jgi:multidrug efflux pump
MKITDLFIRRPVLALVVNLIIVIAGLQAIRTLNVRQYPRSENAAVTVTTVYVGADSNLVRGFVTTPLERAIAAADGIEYMESQSSLGLSTINVRLKLNYDATKALAEISSKVDQVRGDLPPEAEIPVINIESADSQFASAYLSFTSDILEQNEITDYLVRAIQPRLSAVAGVQRADILGARTFAMRIWLKPERMAALNISPAQVRQALAANNFLAALGRTKGALIQVNLTANTNLRTVEDFKRLACGSGAMLLCAWARSPTWCWARKTMMPMSASRGRPPSSWGSGPSPRPIPSTSSNACGPRWRRSRRICPSVCRPAWPTTPPTTSTPPFARCSKPSATRC